MWKIFDLENDKNGGEEDQRWKFVETAAECFFASDLQFGKRNC